MITTRTPTVAAPVEEAQEVSLVIKMPTHRLIKDLWHHWNGPQYDSKPLCAWNATERAQNRSFYSKCKTLCNFIESIKTDSAPNSCANTPRATSKLFKQIPNY